MDDTGEVRRFRGTSPRTQFSMIKKWFRLTQLMDVERVMPQILDRLREFEQVRLPIVKWMQCFPLETCMPSRH